MNKISTYRHENVWLRDYLKQGFHPNDYTWFVHKFLDVEVEDEIDFGEQWIEKASEEEIEEFKEWVQNNNPNQGDTYAPAYESLDYQHFLKPTWLVHFTDDPEGIETHGFKHGFEDFEGLHLTTHFTNRHKGPGYNFAFPIGSRDSYNAERSNKYGKGAVVFWSGGVEALHYGDEENQIIFWGPGVDSSMIFPVYNVYDEWVVFDRDSDYDRPKISGDFEKVINWVTQNWRQIQQPRERIDRNTAAYNRRRTAQTSDRFHTVKTDMFETGTPVEFNYLRNKEKSWDMGEIFQQHIEPAGRFMILDELKDGKQPDTWESGEAMFERPLVIAFNSTPNSGYDETGWKMRLHKAYGGLSGIELSQAIIADGYDGIVTVGIDEHGRPTEIKEIIDLRPTKKSETQWQYKYGQIRDDDEGYVEDPSGRTFWGSRGSGILFVRNHPTLGQQFLTVQRSPHVEEPNTWGNSGGGAVPRDETDLLGSALRETQEEIGSLPTNYRVLRSHVFQQPGGTFMFTTYILEVLDNWEPSHDKFNMEEASDFQWVNADQAQDLDVHFGLSHMLGALGENIYTPEEKKMASYRYKFSKINGEWFIDEDGHDYYADGDVSDVNHEIVATQSMIPDEYLYERFNDAHHGGEELTPEERAQIEVYEPGFLKHIEYGGDARDWVVEKHNWIRVHENNFQLFTLDPKAVYRIARFLGERIDHEDIYGEEMDAETIYIEENSTGRFKSFTAQQIFSADGNEDAYARLIMNLRKPNFASSSWQYKYAAPMDISTALDVFGFPHDTLPDKEEIKSRFRQLSFKRHPDQGGSNESFSELQNAYESLQGNQPGSSWETSRQRRSTEIPEWQTDSRSSYNKVNEDLGRRDINYCLREIYMYSRRNGEHIEEWTFWAFDGSFFRGVFTAKSNESSLGFGGEVMEDWNSKGGNPYDTEAVFASRSGIGNILLVRLHGQDVSDQNITFEHDSFNDNPSNDNSFVQQIRKFVLNSKTQASKWVHIFKESQQTYFPFHDTKIDGVPQNWTREYEQELQTPNVDVDEWLEDLIHSSTNLVEQIIPFLDRYGVIYEIHEFPTGKQVLTIESPKWILEQDDNDIWYSEGDDSLNYWLEHAEEHYDQYLSESDESKDFWDNVGKGSVVYHGTNEESVENILKQGIEARNVTRGLANRGTGAAVFTSMNVDEAVPHYSHIFSIDLGAMKENGYMPTTGVETPIEDAERRQSLAYGIGEEDHYEDVESGISPSTVVIYGDIPPEYIELVE